MKDLRSRWAQWVVGGRWWVIATAMGLVGLALLPMQHLYYDNSNESYFVAGDPSLEHFDLLLDLFGDVEYLSVGITSPQDTAPLDTAPQDTAPQNTASQDTDVFTTRTLRVVQELTDFLEARPEVTQVRSLSKYDYTHAGGGAIATDNLIDNINDPVALAEAREIIRGEELALGSLLTRDLRHTRVVARVKHDPGNSATKVSLMRAVYQFIDQQDYANRGYPLHLSGQPVFYEQFDSLSKRDQAWLNPAMVLVMLVILFFSFRSLAGMLLPWVAIGTSIAWVTGLQGFMRWPHTVVESALVPALIIMGVGISVHVIVEFYRQRNEGRTPPAAAIATIEHLWTPAFYTGLTTAAGFLALGVTELMPVKQFAWLGAIGAMTLFVVALTLLPAILSFVNKLSPKTSRAVDSGVVARLTRWLPAQTRRYRKPLLIAGSVLLAISLYLVPRIQVDSNFITYFKQDNPARMDLLYFDRVYHGLQNVDIIIDSGTEGGIHDPIFLRDVESFQEWLEAQAETGAVNSLLDFHKQINKALHSDDPKWYRLPDSRQLAAQFLLLYDNSGPDEDLSDAKDFYERYLRIAVPITNMDASATRAFLNGVEQYVDRHHPDLNVKLTGSLVMFNAQDIYINEGMFRSFLVALAIIGLAFIILFRSIKYGLIALIPSVVPILITGAVLVVLGIPLDLGTMVVGAMTMGIAVDDAIHVMNRYLSARRNGSDTHEAVQFAMNQAGRAVVFTSIVLVTGFSVMLLGSFIPYIYVGWMAATIMALAVVGDLVFLPALLYAVDGSAEDRAEKLGSLRHPQESVQLKSQFKSTAAEANQS